MSLELSIRESAAGLVSVRATERKKCAETLNSFLSGNAAPSLLTKNTKSKSGFNWDNLFDHINDFILKETEIFEKSKSYENVTKPLATSILHKAVAGGKKGGAYIKCDKITNACLFILQNHRLSRAIGDAYLTLLYKYVVSSDYYVGFISPQTWEELLHICVSTCNSSYFQLDNYTKLRLVSLIMLKGIKSCQFISPMRDVLLKVQKELVKSSNDKKIQEVIIEITLLLVQSLSSEYRLTMCEFTEAVLGTILTFYDQNMDKKKALLFKLLKIVVVLHHPLGRLQNEEGSLAHSWNIWNKHLDSIIEMIDLEVKAVQKSSDTRFRLKGDYFKDFTDFFDLAALVLHQVFNISIQRNEDGNCSSSKRQRVAFYQNRTFSDLIEQLRRNHTPWLGIISVYIKNNAKSVKTLEYITLLNVLDYYVNNNNSVHWETFEELGCLVLRNISTSGTMTEEGRISMVSLWDSCIRQSTNADNSHKATHGILQCLLNCDVINFQKVQPLMKLYHDKIMPITDWSIKTLTIILHIFFSKYNNTETKLECLTWLIRSDTARSDMTNIQDLLKILLTDEKVASVAIAETGVEYDNLYDIIFNSSERFIMFNEFLLSVNQQTSLAEVIDEKAQVNNDVEERFKNRFELILTENLEQLKNNKIQIVEFARNIKMVIDFCDVIMKSTNIDISCFVQCSFYKTVEISLKYLFSSMTQVIQKLEDNPDNIELLIIVQSLLSANYNEDLSKYIRLCFEKDFFKSAYNAINQTDASINDDTSMDTDDVDANSLNLRQHCIKLLTTYCRINIRYRQDILDLILSSDLYTFRHDGDITIAFQCMSILIDSSVTSPPYESVLGLMLTMCRELFRNSEATCVMLGILLRMIKAAWRHISETMKKNCSIMIDTYLQRCKNLYYSPNVAALIYECVVTIDEIKRREDENNRSKLQELLITGTIADTHSLRIYCCYLIKMLAAKYERSDVQIHVSESLQLFSINAAGKSEEMLKDELANRTLSVLHGFFAIAQVKTALINTIIKAILKVQALKSLDKTLVKMVLDKIMNHISVSGIEGYLKNNLLTLLHFWFSEKYKLEDMPIYLLGFNNINSFIDSNIKWVVPAEILWCNKGNIKDSNVVKKIQHSNNTSVEKIVEMCFSNIIILLLPYVVAEKYNLQYEKQESQEIYVESAKNAQTMFRQMNQIIGSKFGELFFDKMGDLVLLSASHVLDYEDLQRVYDLDIPPLNESFYYPKEVYTAILKYFGEVTNSEIMHFLCEQQPMIVSKIILKLWGNVLQQKYLESKTCALHNFIVFIKSLHLGYSADHFLCNFSCNNVLHAIKETNDKKELKIWLAALNLLFQTFLPMKSDILRDLLPLAVSLLKIIKKEGFEDECNTMLELVISTDHTDGLILASQKNPKRSSSSSYSEFNETLKTYSATLNCPSFEIISNFHQFLKANMGYVKVLFNSLNPRGFSEDSKTSVLHNIVRTLNKILMTVYDEKTVLEACNCLSVIGSYDLKTLVMVAPPDSKNVVDLKPAQYLAIVMMRSLSQALVDEEPVFVSKVIATLARLLKYREGKIAFDLGEVDQHIFQQFVPAKCNYPAAKFQLNNSKLEACRKTDMWLPTESENHSKWICRLTKALINIITFEENYLSTLGAVCESKPRLCQSILPPLIGLILSISHETETTMIKNHINCFLDYFYDKTFDGSCSENSESPTRKNIDIEYDHKIMILDVLEVVDFVRLQRIQYMKRPDEVETLNYLKLDYAKVAWAACVAERSLHAVYYGELWAVARPAESPAQPALPVGEDILTIFRMCYTSIGETDAIEGCGSGHLGSEHEKRKHLINTGQFTDALLFHDIALSYESDSQEDLSLEYGVIRSLHKSGMHHLALQYIKTLPENDKLDDVKYDCLSFLGDWSVFVDIQEAENKLKCPNANVNSLLNKLRYACLKDCINILPTPESEDKLTLPINRAKLAVSKLSQKLNMDNCQSVYKVISQLQIFKDIEAYYAVRCNKLAIKDLLFKWQVDNLAPFQDFKHVETLISQRSVILQHAAKSYSHLLNDIVNLQLRYTELGLSNDRIQLSQRLLALTKRSKTSGEISLIEGQISWVKGHKDIALSLLRNITNNETQDVKLTAAALKQYGNWMAESKCENARVIIDKYLKRSLEVLSTGENDAIKQKIYYDIAKFADSEYKQVVSYMKSPIFENKVKCMENMKGTASSLRSTQQFLTREEKKALMTNERLSILDEAEINNTIAEKKRFLELAMKYYLLSLNRDEENNLSVFRIVSLWLDNPEFELETEGETFARLLRAVPSRKYIPVLPQLAPRLTIDDDAFAKNLNEIITRCSQEHPHHTLPVLFGLKNSDKDKVIMNASADVGNASKKRGGSEEPRIVAAAKLIQDLGNTDRGLRSIIDQMELMCDAIISFANYESKSKDMKQAVPKAERISKLKNLSDIPIPTITLPIRGDCNYTDFPAIASFANSFELVGGINCPKKMLCRGSDGRDRILLIKGQDDLRQDAVMQQVFNIVNTLLEINPVTSRNKLLIRTYKVVPLSRRSGVLEWCAGTTPLGAYLVGGSGGGGVSGAHARYRPKVRDDPFTDHTAVFIFGDFHHHSLALGAYRDISCSAARAKLNACHSGGKSNSTKLATFLAILKEFKPVFHYFFTEHYLDPVTWYERRLAYTKSVATSSMVGYIMGLGDRHVQNILIDKNTAEVIHIDFGIAFDQGKALPTPETIPFRLTQDILAGFGCSGVEGVFRRCCEKTMQLLRDNHEALLTILEVLLCDPLYSWSITPAQAKRKQDILSTTPRDAAILGAGGAEGGGGLAERALLAVASKLRGTEGGAAGGVSVQGQVATLIHAATDPLNLCRLFPGWQPYI